MNGIWHISSPPSHPPPGPWAVVFLIHAIAWVLWWSPHPVAYAVVPASESTSDPWAPPIAGASEADVVNSFIPPQVPWSAAHRGVDIRATTDEIVAPAAGEVTFVGTVVDRSVLTIRHANGVLSSFEPVESDLQAGDTVAQGQVVGTLSDETSHCAVECLHWGVRKPDAWHIGSTVRDLYLDPAFLLGWTEPSVLWPIHTDPEP